MHVIFKTEHGEIAVTEYKFAVQNAQKTPYFFCVITPVNLLCEIEEELDSDEFDMMEIGEKPQILNDKGNGCYIEILEMFTNICAYLETFLFQTHKNRHYSLLV